MIDALDHLTVRASFRDGAVGAYETLLGRRAEDGRLRVGNVGLAIEDHASTAQLSSMVFATASLDKAQRLLERRAVPSERDGDRLMLSTAGDASGADRAGRARSDAASPRRC